jgi:triacylglycerol lipase
MYFPNGFNKELAIELGELVIQAYEQFDKFENGGDWKLPKPYELIDVFEYAVKSDTILGIKIPNYDNIKKFLKLKDKDVVVVPMGFIAKNENKIFIVFRGTKTPKEWISNLTISMKEYFIPSYGNVHEGFLEVYNSIKETIDKNKAIIAGNNKIFVTGHSLGAALATLSLPDIEINHGKKIDALYTFGSPRVGDALFVRKFDGIFENRSFRVVNTSDVVTSIPLPIPIIGSLGGYFSHVDIPIDFTFQSDDISKNHAMETYIDEIQKVKANRNILQLLFKRRK